MFYVCFFLLAGNAAYVFCMTLQAVPQIQAYLVTVCEEWASAVSRKPNIIIAGELFVVMIVSQTELFLVELSLTDWVMLTNPYELIFSLVKW